MSTRAARTARGFTQPVPLSYTETAMFVQMQYSKACSICLLALLVPVLMVPWSGTAAPGEALRLAVTTSTDDSGLLAVLRPVFEVAAGYSLRVVVTGSGKALRLGRDGEVDMLIVHSPAAEQAFMAGGWGSGARRSCTMTLCCWDRRGRSDRTSWSCCGNWSLPPPDSSPEGTIPAPMSGSLPCGNRPG